MSRIALVSLCIAAIGATLATGRVSSTVAAFSDTVSAHASVQATLGAVPPTCPPISLIPGRSRAHYVTQACPYPHVARLENKRLYLDYGEIRQDGRLRSTEVLLVRNISGTTLKLTCSVEGTVAALFRSCDLTPARLKPAEQAVLCTVIEPRGAAPGLYEGIIRIRVASPRFEVAVPVTIRVLPAIACATAGASPDVTGDVTAHSGLVVESTVASQSAGPPAATPGPQPPSASSEPSASPVEP